MASSSGEAVGVGCGWSEGGAALSVELVVRVVVVVLYNWWNAGKCLE